MLFYLPNMPTQRGLSQGKTQRLRKENLPGMALPVRGDLELEHRLSDHRPLGLTTMQRCPLPRSDARYHAAIPATMQLCQLPCSDASYHAAMPATTQRCPLPRSDAHYHAVMPTTTQQCPLPRSDDHHTILQTRYFGKETTYTA